MNTIKVKATNPESQGPYVVIDASEFVEGTHEHYVEPAPAPAPEAGKAKAAKGAKAE